MSTITLPPLISNGKPLDTSPESFGFFRDSAAAVDDTKRLGEIMASDGYLYLPGFFERDQVQGARTAVLEQLDAFGLLYPGKPLDEGWLNTLQEEDRRGAFDLHAKLRLEQRHPVVWRLLYGQRIMEFFKGFLGGEATHYDFTWFRTISPGRGTPCHCDIVFMGRGTFDLYTLWTPLGDSGLEMGGLMVLEDSHRKRDRLHRYLDRDVDLYCANGPYADEFAAGTRRRNGQLSRNPPQLRNSLGGRWLTSEFSMGDVVIFQMGMVHCSLDNQTGRYRLSTDTRYQLASEPIDDRWVGDQPVGHGPRGKRAMIC